MGGALGALEAPFLPASDAGLLGDALHGGDDGRHDAVAADGDRLHARAHARHRGAARVCSSARVAAHAVTVLLLRRSILTEKIARRGHHLVREYCVDPFEIHRVGEVMDRDVADDSRRR